MMNYNPFAHYSKKIRIDFITTPNVTPERSIVLLHRIFGATYSMGIFDYLFILPVLLKLILIHGLNKRDSLPGNGWRRKLAVGIIFATRILFAPFFLLKTGLLLATLPITLLIWGIKKIIDKQIKSPHVKLLNSLLVSENDNPVPRPLAEINPLCNADVPLYGLSFFGNDPRSLMLSNTWAMPWQKGCWVKILPIKENILTLHQLMKTPELLPLDGNIVTLESLRFWINQHKAPIVADIVHRRMHRLLMTPSTSIDDQLTPKNLHDVQRDIRKQIFELVVNSDAQALPQQNAGAVMRRNNI